MLTKAKNRSTTFIVFLLLCFGGYLSAQDATFKVSAPNAVAKGETFRVVYTLQNAESESPIQAATSIKGFDVLYGPATSISHSTSIINGKAQSSSSESYIYTLSANSEGTFTIPAATIKANGRVYTSNTVQIKVLPPDKNNQAATQQSQGNHEQASPSSTSANIKSSDAFIRAIVSKTRVREQEAFVVTFRFYTTLEVRDIGKIEFPEFEGFMVEEQELPGSRQLTMEHYNGRNYYAVDLRRTLLFPQRSGQITIPQGKIEMVFSVRSGKTVNSFLGPQHVMTDVKKTMTSAPLNINVQELPAGKPDNFSNGVGNFSMTPSISATNIKANDAVTLKLKISGTGNMKLIKTPELNLPKDFEVYDPKITNDLKFTNNGLTGSKTIEYLFIPRYQGTYKIAPIELSYFDMGSNSYKTLKTPEYTIEVAKDPNAGSASATSFTQTNVEVEKDIRYLKTGKPSFIKINSFLVGSMVYYLWYIIPLVLFIAFFIVNRKKIQENTDIVKTKNKRANKVATKRLKEALKHLNAQQKEKFYEELLRATWGYLSDKLSIPIANLNRNNVETELAKFGAKPALTEKFIHILDTCEFARYAPVESDTAMDDLYQNTVSAIGEMENPKTKNQATQQ